MTKETKVGIFTLAGLAVFAWGILMLGDVRIKQRYPLIVYFQSAEGLPEKGPVKVAGVEVGLVETVLLEGEKAKVAIRLDKTVEVHRNARARISSTGLIGTKYLELSLGDASAPVLSPGDVLQGETSISMDEIMKKLSDFFRDDPEKGSPSDNLRETFAHLKNITGALDAALGQQEERLTDIVQNIHSMTVHGKTITENVDDIVQKHKEDVEIALAKIRSISERMDNLMAKIERGEGTLGKLVTDDEMGKDLKETVTSVKKAATDASAILGRIGRIEAYWDYRQRYDFEASQAHADVGLRIVPRPGKFYFLQGNNLGRREDRTIAGNDFEKKNTVTAVMGRDFGPVTLFGGVIRSAGGAGVRLRPLQLLRADSPLAKRFELEGEGYDFGRDVTIQGIHFDHPNYNAGARILVRDPWLYVGGQVEDIMERKNFNANVNITFKDEDIAYLLGFVGLASR